MLSSRSSSACKTPAMPGQLIRRHIRINPLWLGAAPSQRGFVTPADDRIPLGNVDATRGKSGHQARSRDLGRPQLLVAILTSPTWRSSLRSSASHGRSCYASSGYQQSVINPPSRSLVASILSP
jgi:hypothetical protein